MDNMPQANTDVTCPYCWWRGKRDEFEAPPRPYYLQEQRTIIERYEKDGKAMVRYETTDEWGETIHHIVQFASFRRWAKRATVLYAAEVLSK